MKTYELGDRVSIDWGGGEIQIGIIIYTSDTGRHCRMMTEWGQTIGADAKDYTFISKCTKEELLTHCQERVRKLASIYE